MMRFADVFSQAGLGVIAAGLLVATLAGAEPAGKSEVASGTPTSAASTSEQAPAVDADQAAPSGGLSMLGRWAAPYLPKAATAPQSVADDAAPAPPAQPAALATPTLTTAVHAPADTPQSAAAPTASAATPPATAADAEPQPGGTPGLKPAKVLFGTVKQPAPLAARAIGTYARGCLSGGQALPVDGPAWQAMRLSRNRNWGHPKLIALIEKLATEGRAKDGWPGLLVGDIAQPRGGPMLTGHASHQIGLDADIWLTPMPDRRLTNEEREAVEATSMLSEDGLAVARDHWTDGHLNIIRRAASYPDVERILVHPAIKQVLCHAASGDRHWLSKVRPYWGHHYHFHVRIGCPPSSADCTPQKPVPGDDGCGKELEDWLTLLAKIKPEPAPLPIPPPIAAKPPKEKPPITLDQLPQACRVVLATGNPAATLDVAAAAKAAAKSTEAAAKTEKAAAGSAKAQTTAAATTTKSAAATPAAKETAVTPPSSKPEKKIATP